VIVAYPEFTPGNGLRRPTLLSPDGIAIPALAVTDEVGRRLSALGSGTSVRVAVDARNPTRLLRNVIAETPGGSALKVVMAGGHLDSVVDGPGINDNGSGVATLIEIAEELIGSEPRNKVRFVFWAGEEYGLLGSRHYVDSLNPLEIRDIAVYLNFDMLASPNYVPLVYDNSGAPDGSGSVTKLFMDHFAAAGEDAEPIDLTGRSDHFAFEEAGVPVGGLFSGAEEIKTEDEADAYGGEAGRPLDRCYHQSCDDISNIDDDALALLADAAADVVAALAENVDELIVKEED
jgi:Zn-dependent M28 family amino/carboxypeptidase